MCPERYKLHGHCPICYFHRGHTNASILSEQESFKTSLIRGGYPPTEVRSVDLNSKPQKPTRQLLKIINPMK